LRTKRASTTTYRHIRPPAHSLFSVSHGLSGVLVVFFVSLSLFGLTKKKKEEALAKQENKKAAWKRRATARQ
jgi:succinate dehydrogenase/fumarate reductase cytochrome b subunit